MAQETNLRAGHRRLGTPPAENGGTASQFAGKPFQCEVAQNVADRRVPEWRAEAANGTSRQPSSRVREGGYLVKEMPWTITKST
jgi:hypothetical protein